MRSPRLLAAVLVLGAFGSGCGDERMPQPGPDAGAPDAGVVQPQPIAGDHELWTWIPFDDAFCADGKPTGLAVNLTDRSPNAVIFLMGGGACWDYAGCYESPLASYVASGFRESDMPFLTIATTAVGLLNRDDPTNPFRDYSVIAVPYCTGDAFTGSRTAVYDGRETMHVGHANVMAYLKRLVPTFPNAERIVVVGASAGGIGAAFNWWHIQKAFGDIRVDMIDDSGAVLPSPYLSDALLQTWRDTWGIDEGLPPGCAECKTKLGALFSYTAAATPKGRGALLSYDPDSVLPGFMSISQSQFAKGLDALAAESLDPLPRVRYFFRGESSHVLMPHSDLEQNGVRLWDWISAMESDDPSWESVRP
jgi:hypothetical protein